MKKIAIQDRELWLEYKTKALEFNLIKQQAENRLKQLQQAKQNWRQKLLEQTDLPAGIDPQKVQIDINRPEFLLPEEEKDGS